MKIFIVFLVEEQGLARRRDRTGVPSVMVSCRAPLAERVAHDALSEG
jgi:hypothetical protein